MKVVSMVVLPIFDTLVFARYLWQYLLPHSSVFRVCQSEHLNFLEHGGGGGQSGTLTFFLYRLLTSEHLANSGGYQLKSHHVQRYKLPS